MLSFGRDNGESGILNSHSESEFEGLKEVLADLVVQ